MNTELEKLLDEHIKQKAKELTEKQTDMWKYAFKMLLDELDRAIKEEEEYKKDSIECGLTFGSIDAEGGFRSLLNFKNYIHQIFKDEISEIEKDGE